MINKYLLAALLLIVSAAAYSTGNIIKLQYSQWTIYYNCEKRGFEYFYYKTVPDNGDKKRYKTFGQEKRLPEKCRQFSTKPYKSPGKTMRYDRGHGVHQNLWDHSEDLMAQSNSMANIVPQEANLNRRGVWRYTEELTECWRDYGTVEVWGGVLWGNDVSNDYFIKSHGVVTPDFLWKIIKFPDGEINAWIMPNDNTPQKMKVDSYLVAPATIAKYTDIKFHIERSQATEKDSKSVRKPNSCSLK